MMDNGFSFVRQTLLQLPEEENVTSDLFAMPNFGLYQLFLLPVAVLGGVAYLVRLARERGRAALPRNVIGVLAADGQDGAWSLPCVACALLLVCMAGYGILFRGLNAGHLSMVLPLLILLCAQGVIYIARRVPLGGALLCAVYALGFALFLGAYFAEYAPARTATTHYNGFMEAAAFASTLDADEVHVTSNVYPHENPDMAVRVLTAFGSICPRRTCWARRRDRRSRAGSPSSTRRARRLSRRPVRRTSCVEATPTCRTPPALTAETLATGACSGCPKPPVLQNLPGPTPRACVMRPFPV